MLLHANTFKNVLLSTAYSRVLIGENHDDVTFTAKFN
jgi:hypothetical protein